MKYFLILFVWLFAFAMLFMLSGFISGTWDIAKMDMETKGVLTCVLGGLACFATCVIAGEVK